MLRLNNDRVLFRPSTRAPNGQHFVIDRQLKVSPIDLGGMYGSIQRVADNTLVMHHQNGCSLVDLNAGNEVKDLIQLQAPSAEFNPNIAFLEVLVDTVSSTYLTLSLAYERFELDDPGYSGPSGVSLLPDSRIAISIHRNLKYAVYNWKLDDLTYFPLAGRQGIGHPQVRNNTLWMTDYDTLCRVDLDTMTANCSDILQPAIEHNGHHMRQYIGVPEHVGSIKSWVIPRPFSGDFLLVSDETLEPVSTLKAGGRPYAACVMDDGFVFSWDLPSCEVRTFHLDQFSPF